MTQKKFQYQNQLILAHLLGLVFITTLGKTGQVCAGSNLKTAPFRLKRCHLIATQLIELTVLINGVLIKKLTEETY